MDQHSIEIYECKHNITHIGNQYTLCISMKGREFTTKSGNCSLTDLPKMSCPSLSQGTLQCHPNA